MTTIHCLADLGLSDYRKMWQLQHTLHAHCRATGKNVLILTQHAPVVTLGYRRQSGQVRLSAAALRAKRIAVVAVERGGGATYHGPGQLVAYPIFSSLLRKYGVRGFIARLEEVMCRVSHSFAVQATRMPGLPGVWVGERKLGAVGIAVRGGTSLHGCALNVTVDLQPFSYIVPCGLVNKTVTSLALEREMSIPMAAVAELTRRSFAEVFGGVMEDIADEWSGLKRETHAGPLDYHQPS